MDQRCMTNKIRLLRRKRSHGKLKGSKKKRTVSFQDISQRARKQAKIFAGNYMNGGKEGNNNEEQPLDYESEEEFPYTLMPSQKHYIGGPTATCPHCQAMMWDEERVNKSQKKQPPEFAICCGKGAVKLPLLKEAPEFLKKLMQYVDGGPQASNFRLNIRAYNSMFAFTSQGAKVSKEQNNGSSPWVFTMYGLNHHFMGSLFATR
ncbi:uncharacterized protein LOC113327706 [Papaver somniferum]|uniref:uncharacterized protein LOC113327706 n=1 Tax=Papaver somniferum TaxID=3469 RepID=UPI000E6FEBA6|nr:uncharacterized protein LOC113327706 [Papaver somniferum]